MTTNQGGKVPTGVVPAHPVPPRGGSTPRLSVIGTCRVVGCSDDGHPGYHHPGPPLPPPHPSELFSVEVWHLGASEPVEGRVDFVTHIDGRTHLVVTLDDGSGWAWDR